VASNSTISVSPVLLGGGERHAQRRALGLRKPFLDGRRDCSGGEPSGERGGLKTPTSLRKTSGLRVSGSLTEDLQLGECLLQSKNTCVGDVSAGQDETVELGVSYDCDGCSGYSAATPEAVSGKYFMEYCLFVTLMPIIQLQHRNLLP
jgi:hypothetical protein